MNNIIFFLLDYLAVLSIHNYTLIYWDYCYVIIIIIFNSFNIYRGSKLCITNNNYTYTIIYQYHCDVVILKVLCTNVIYLYTYIFFYIYFKTVVFVLSYSVWVPFINRVPNDRPFHKCNKFGVDCYYTNVIDVMGE